MRSFLTCLIFCCALQTAPAQLFKKKDKEQEKSEPAPLVQVDTLAEVFPAGALAFAETAALGDLLSYVRGTSLLDLFLKSKEFGNVKRSSGFTSADVTRKLLEIALRMSLWEAGAKLLGGEVGLALYPKVPGEDPDVVALVRPSELSTWLKTRVILAPLVRIGLMRVERFFGNDVVIFRTRGNKDKATYVAFHDRWVVIGSDLDLLKKAVFLQLPADPERQKEEVIAQESAYQQMTQKMGRDHLARAFVNTRRVPEAAGEDLGAGEVAERDPLLALYLGGVLDMLTKSRYAGLALNKVENMITLRTSIDARAEDLDEKHRVLFTGGKGRVEKLPELPGLLGGFSMLRQVSNWYGEQGESVFKSAALPGFEKFEGVLKLLMVQGEKPMLGDQFVFVSALAGDGGVSRFSGAKMPGFVVQADLANPEETDAALDALFPVMLQEISESTARAERHINRDNEGDTKETDEPEPAPNDWVIALEEVDGIAFCTAVSPTHPGMQPAALCVKDALIIGSSLELCQAIAKRRIAGNSEWVVDTDFTFSVRFGELAKFFEANEDAYKSTITRESKSGRTGEEAVKGVAMMLATLKSITGSTTAAKGSLDFFVKGELR
jgi:hypothetical protein